MPPLPELHSCCFLVLSRKLPKPTPSGTSLLPVTRRLSPSHLHTCLFPPHPRASSTKSPQAKSGCCPLKSASSPGLSGWGGGLDPRKATVLRFPLSSPPPPDSPQLLRSSLKEILCSDVGSLLGRRRAQHKGAERVNWPRGGGAQGGRGRGRILCV